VRLTPGGMRGRVISVGVVVAGLAAAYGAGSVVHPATVGSVAKISQAARADVNSATRACPSPGTVGVTAAGVAAVSVRGTATQGRAAITRLSGAGSPVAGPAVATLTKPSMLSVAKVSAAPKPRSRAVPGDPDSGGVITIQGRGGVMVQASGALAQGLEVEQTSPSGLVTAQCQPPGTDFWFAGPSATSASLIEMYLMNTDSQPADVQVDALTDNGPLLGGADTGIVVPPHAIIGQSLSKLLHGSRVVALHVSTSQGRVVAAVRENDKGGGEGAWLPETQAPTRNQVIPGLPSSRGTRTLYVAVPGTAAAQIKVTAVTSRGSYHPTGGSGIDLAGDSAAAIALPSLSGVPAALQISSSVPVAAAVLVPGGVSGSPGALSAAAAPVSEQAIAADNPASADGSASLVISAPQGSATVRILTATSKTGFSGQQATVVHVAAGHTVLTRIRPPGRKQVSFAVVVTPEAGSGPVYVGRVISSRGGIVRTIMPMTSALTWVPLPVAEQALAVAGTRRG
jgi:hypothetical protein